MNFDDQAIDREHIWSAIVEAFKIPKFPCRLCRSAEIVLNNFIKIFNELGINPGLFTCEGARDCDQRRIKLSAKKGK